MGVANKQIGWSQEASLLHSVSKQLEQLTGVIAAATSGGGGIPVTAGFLQVAGGTAITPALKAVTDATNISSALRIGTTAIDNYGTGGAATNSTAFGTNALDTATGSSYGNIAIGFNVLTSLTVSSYNTAVGAGAMTTYNDLDGSGTKGQNTAIGAFSFYAATSGKWNTAIGSSAMQNGAPSFSIAIGAHCGENMGGSSNISLGCYAGSATSGSNNIQMDTAVAAGGVTTGSNNIIISGAVKAGITTGSGNVVLGPATGITGATANNIYLASGGGIKARHDGTNWNFTGQINKVALDTAPASAVAAGVLGEIRFTATHVYLCTAANTWVRAALATW